MILQSLVKYYNILSEDPDSDISKPGYSKVKVSFALNLSEQGELLEVIPLKRRVQNGKKLQEVPILVEVPEQAKRAVGIISNFLCENSTYALGIDNKGKPQRSIECFNAFAELHRNLLSDAKCREAKALLNFLSEWDPAKAKEHPALSEYLDEILKGANLVFKLDGGEFLHQNQELRQIWESHISDSKDDVIMPCLITGEPQPIARLHPSIKGVMGAQPTGASIVSFNQRSFESYGRDEAQGLNSPIGKYAAFAYATVLNSMLSEQKYRLILGDATVFYWAESSNPAYKDAISLLFAPEETTRSEESEKTEEKAARDKQAERLVKSIFEKIAQGSPLGDFSDELDKNTRFYVLGLSPNSSRLSVRFFVTDSFGGFVEKIAAHYRDLKIVKQSEKQPDAIPLWQLLKETISPKSKEKAASPLMSGSVLRSIITGSPYPASLFKAVMCRIKAEGDISYQKAAIIKAFLTRKHKDNQKYKEVLKLALNEQSTNRAYLLGRLFAVLEKAQEEAAASKLNSTIKDRYFTSACATPASVFPILLRLSQHHIAKSEYGYVSDRRIEEILNKLDIASNPIPSHLSLDEQGIFILGYYHQRNAFFTKKEKENE